MKRAKKIVADAVLVEQSFAALDRGGTNAKDVTIAIKQRAAAAISEGKSQIVTQGGGANSHQDDVGELQFVLRIGQEAGQEENRLARQGNPRILEQKRNAYRPIAIVSDVTAKGIENWLPHAGWFWKRMVILSRWRVRCTRAAEHFTGN